MFDDPKKELEDLEKKLLAAEDDDWLDKQLMEAKALIGDAPRKKKARRPEDTAPRSRANDYGEQPPKTAKPVKAAPKKEQVLYTDEYDEEDEYEDEQPREKGVRGLIVVACLETLGIVGIVAYWLIHLL